MRKSLVLSAVLAACVWANAEDAARQARVQQVVNALTRAIHCYQVSVHEEGREGQKPGQGDPQLFSKGDLSIEKIKEVKASGDLLLENPDAVVAWVEGKPAQTDLGAGTGVVKIVEDLNQVKLPESDKLPRNLIYNTVKNLLGGKDDLSAQAYANIMQESIDIPNPGPQMRQMVVLYYRLGLKVNLRQLGLPGGNMDMKKLADELWTKMGDGPFGGPHKDKAQSLWVSLTVTETGGEKWTGHGDCKVLGRKMLEDPEIQPLVPIFKAMGPRRFVFAGHSCHANHWTTDASWCLIAAEAIKAVNPQLEYVDFGKKFGNGPDAIVKYQLTAILDCRPTDLLLTVLDDDARQQSITKIITECQKIHCRVMVADYLWGWRPLEVIGKPQYKGANNRAALAKLGGDFLEFFKLPREKKVPDLDTWEGADGVHMNTVGHIFYAREFLKWLAAKDKASQIEY